CKKNNRQATAFLAQYCLELKAVEARHRYIKHKTPRHLWIVLREKFPGRHKVGHGNAGRTQQTRDSFSYCCVVVHDKHGGAGQSRHYSVFISHLPSPEIAGRSSQKSFGNRKNICSRAPRLTLTRRPLGPWLQQSSTTNTVGLG